MTRITSACPTCGATETRETYDIGSGPELACVQCDWCWGAEGQDLKPLDVAALRQSLLTAGKDWVQTEGREDEN